MIERASPEEQVRSLRSREHVLVADAGDATGAGRRLCLRFGLDEAQATAILDMQLRRVSALERARIAEEVAQSPQEIACLTGGSPGWPVDRHHAELGPSRRPEWPGGAAEESRL
ncbi:MAG: hypothetical protein QOF39_1949 [Frankiales bacterium]|jgi:hypothetical protein|nr:hypothetical protein [Frankiales bacterium]